MPSPFQLLTKRRHERKSKPDEEGARTPASAQSSDRKNSTNNQTTPQIPKSSLGAAELSGFVPKPDSSENIVPSPQPAYRSFGDLNVHLHTSTYSQSSLYLNQTLFFNVIPGQIICIQFRNASGDQKVLYLEVSASTHVMSNFDLSIHESIAQSVGITARHVVRVSSVAPDVASIGHMDVIIIDGVLARSETWFLLNYLKGKNLYLNQRLSVDQCTFIISSLSRRKKPKVVGGTTVNVETSALKRPLSSKLSTSAKVNPATQQQSNKQTAYDQNMCGGMVIQDTSMVFRSGLSNMYVGVHLTRDILAIDTSGYERGEIIIDFCLRKLFEIWEKHRYKHSLTLFLFYDIEPSSSIKEPYHHEQLHCVKTACVGVTSKWHTALSEIRDYKSILGDDFSLNSVPIGCASVAAAQKYCLSQSEYSSIMPFVSFVLKDIEYNRLHSLSQLAHEHIIIISPSVPIFYEDKAFHDTVLDSLHRASVGIDFISVAPVCPFPVPQIILRENNKHPQSEITSFINSAFYSISENKFVRPLRSSDCRFGYRTHVLDNYLSQSYLFSKAFKNFDRQYTSIAPLPLIARGIRKVPQKPSFPAGMNRITSENLKKQNATTQSENSLSGLNVLEGFGISSSSPRASNATAGVSFDSQQNSLQEDSYVDTSSLSNADSFSNKAFSPRPRNELLSTKTNAQSVANSDMSYVTQPESINEYLYRMSSKNEIVRDEYRWRSVMLSDFGVTFELSLSAPAYLPLTKLQADPIAHDSDEKKNVYSLILGHSGFVSLILLRLIHSFQFQSVVAPSLNVHSINMFHWYSEKHTLSHTDSLIEVFSLIPPESNAESNDFPLTVLVQFPGQSLAREKRFKTIRSHVVWNAADHSLNQSTLSWDKLFNSQIYKKWHFAVFSERGNHDDILSFIESLTRVHPSLADIGKRMMKGHNRMSDTNTVRKQRMIVSLSFPMPQMISQQSPFLSTSGSSIYQQTQDSVTSSQSTGFVYSSEVESSHAEEDGHTHGSDRSDRVEDKLRSNVSMHSIPPTAAGERIIGNSAIHDRSSSPNTSEVTHDNHSQLYTHSGVVSSKKASDKVLKSPSISQSFTKQPSSTSALRQVPSLPSHSLTPPSSSGTVSTPRMKNESPMSVTYGSSGFINGYSTAESTSSPSQSSTNDFGSSNQPLSLPCVFSCESFIDSVNGSWSFDIFWSVTPTHQVVALVNSMKRAAAGKGINIVKIPFPISCTDSLLKSLSVVPFAHVSAPYSIKPSVNLVYLLWLMGKKSHVIYRTCGLEHVTNCLSAQYGSFSSSRSKLTGGCSMPAEPSSLVFSMNEGNNQSFVEITGRDVYILGSETSHMMNDAVVQSVIKWIDTLESVSDVVTGMIDTISGDARFR